MKSTTGHYLALLANLVDFIIFKMTLVPKMYFIYHYTETLPIAIKRGPIADMIKCRETNISELMKQFLINWDRLLAVGDYTVCFFSQ